MMYIFLAAIPEGKPVQFDIADADGLDGGREWKNFKFLSWRRRVLHPQAPVRARRF